MVLRSLYSWIKFTGSHSSTLANNVKQMAHPVVTPNILLLQLRWNLVEVHNPFEHRSLKFSMSSAISISTQDPNLTKWQNNATHMQKSLPASSRNTSLKSKQTFYVLLTFIMLNMEKTCSIIPLDSFIFCPYRLDQAISVRKSTTLKLLDKRFRSQTSLISHPEHSTAWRL